MESENITKFIYEDDKITKVLRGYVISEDEFTYKIRAVNSNDIIVLGKRAIIKVG